MSSMVSIERPYACQYCEMRFKDALTHKRHTNVKHTQEECHVCDTCAAIFYTKHKLDVHLASKHGINDQFKCEKCKKFLMSEWTLIKHKRKCSTVPCPVCGKEFLSKWKLENHVQGHLNNRCHICDECGKDFLHSFTLVERIEIVHQGKRPFQCEGCPKTFARKGSLRTHKLIHSGVKPFPCQLCEKKCREKVQLIKHLIKKHRIEENQIQEYVKVMPKKEIVRSEDMQNVLLQMGKIKNEPIEVQETNVFQTNESMREETKKVEETSKENKSTKNYIKQERSALFDGHVPSKENVELKHEISSLIGSLTSNPIDENVETNISSKLPVKTEQGDLLDETTPLLDDVHGGSDMETFEDTAQVTAPVFNVTRPDDSMNSLEEDVFKELEEDALKEDALDEDALEEEAFEGALEECTREEDTLEDDSMDEDEEFTFENIEF